MRVSYQPTSDFTAVLRQRVHAWLATQDPARTRRRMLAKTGIVLLWAAASWALLVFVASSWWTALPLAVALGLGIAAVGFSVGHDANHRSYPAPRWAQRLLGFTMDASGGSSYLWRQQHNDNHHPWTNVAGADDDIALAPWGRLAPSHTWRPWHRWQHLYLWLLYSLLFLRWALVGDWVFLWTGKVGDNPFRRPRGSELALLILGKLVAFSLWLGIPLLLHPLPVVLGAALVAALSMGFAMAVTFQLAHVVEEARWPEDTRSQVDWAQHQLATTVDFATHSRLVTWLSGGLNHQVEHHLFPMVCHLHYPGIARIVAQTAAEHGLSYQAHPSVWSAIRSHYRHLRTLGRRPAVAESVLAA